MLPLLNLTSSDMLSPDALHGAGRLVPADSDALQGGFAGVLQSTVHPAVLGQAPTGADLPPAGNALPVVARGGELQLDAGLELPAAEIDLVLPGPGPTHGAIAAAAPPTLLRELSDAVDQALTGDELAADQPGLRGDELPLTVQVPPQPEGSDADVRDIPVAAADTASDVLADALRAVPLTQASGAEGRGSRAQARDQAASVATAARRTGAVAYADARGPGRELPAHDIDVTAMSRPHAGAGDQAAPPVHRRGPRPDPVYLDRAAADPSQSRDDVARALRDDGLSMPRPVQPAAWQQAAVTAEAASEPGQRTHADFAVALPRTAKAVPMQAAPPLPPAAQAIEIPVQQSGWDNLLAERVTMMAHGKLQNAELRLTPAELGPLRIQLEIDDGVANVSFQSQHPVTREALEQAMPRLRELLAENGLSLGQADVRDDSSQQRSREALAGAAAAGGAGADGGDLDDTTTARTLRRASDSLVDTFA